MVFVNFCCFGNVVQIIVMIFFGGRLVVVFVLLFVLNSVDFLTIGIFIVSKN